jgi:hypothetical protein
MKLGSIFSDNQPFWRNGALLFLASIGLLALGGCAGDHDAPADRSAMLPEDQRVSSVPWNKPQGWENQGSLGALANDPRFGGQPQPP